MVNGKVIKKENIRLKVEAKDWREAIKKSGRVLRIMDI